MSTLNHEPSDADTNRLRAFRVSDIHQAMIAQQDHIDWPSRSLAAELSC